MLIFGHRGAGVGASENTIAAIAEGLELGADGVEVDLRMTADNKIIAIHDITLHRTTGKKMFTGRASANYIQSLNAHRTKDERPPLLDDVLGAVPKGKILQIEIKGSIKSAPFIVDAVNRGQKNIDEIMVLSSSLKTLHYMKEKIPKILTGWVCRKRPIYRTRLPKPEPLIYNLKMSHVDAISFDCRLAVNKKDIDILHISGIKTYSWTVNTLPKCALLKELGVSGITTDYPQIMRNFLSKMDKSIYE